VITSVVVRPLAHRQLLAAAVEPYRKEAGGVLLGTIDGDLAVVRGLHLYQIVKKRTNWTLDTTEESDHRLADWLGAHLIGDWHSHPEARPSATPVDKAEWLTHYPDGIAAIITAVWPTKKSPGFGFSHKAYATHLGKVHRAKLTLL
jgi:proteasome lid subunit RPN8/RPN11